MMEKLMESSFKFDKKIGRGKFSLLLGALLFGSGLSAENLTVSNSSSDYFKTLNSDSTLTISGTNTIDTPISQAIGINGSSKAYTIAVTNEGTINSTTRGISLLSVKDGSTISNTGTILTNAKTFTNESGTEETTYSYGIMVLTSGTATVTNSGTITSKYLNNEFDMEAYSLYYVGTTSALTVNNSGNMNGNILLKKGTFTNSGNISLPYNAKIPALTFIENFTNQGSGKLEIGFKTNGTTTTYSKLSTTNATFEDGSTININVLDGTNITNLVGTTFTGVVSATTALTVNGTLNITDNSDAVDFEYVEGGGIKVIATAPQTAEASNVSFTIDEDTSKTFSSSDFGYTSSGTLQKIIITTLESAGSLKLDGENVILDQEIAIADISKLVFTPVANASGSAYATFGFKVSNGTTVSIDAYTATINVTNIDDAPAIDMTTSYNNISNSENYSITLTASDLDGDTISYTATSNDTSKATAAIVDGKLVITPINSAEGSVTVVLNASANGKVTSQNITIDLITPTLTSYTNLSASKWNMISLPKGKVLNTTLLTGITSEKAVKVYRSGAWVDNPTDVTAKEAIWVNPTNSTLDLSMTTVNTSNDFADKTAQLAYYKGLSVNTWHFVAVQYTMSWNDLTKTVLTPDSCNGYTFVKYYDSANDSWNTTANIPAGAGMWLRHICK